eukprot:TRINITY_DN71826_c0_g1_i1.p4 TRINITY_DN71826_c0_g1~~TRINITY_DN71826_c0_g1_i1.p4  ORF type:complete len:192 (+),score=18.15 TRINITY_DN71826_c0_g1_i1:2264-2839(+)
MKLLLWQPLKKKRNPQKSTFHSFIINRVTRQASWIYSTDAGMLQDLSDNNQALFKLLEVPQNDQQMFESGLDKFAQWSFDAITFHQMVGEQGFLMLCLKVISAHVVIKTLSVPVVTLIDFLKEVYKSVQKDPKPYHNAAYIMDNLQALHFLLHVGNFKKYFTEADLFGLIIACIICDYNHPYTLNNKIVED